MKYSDETGLTQDVDNIQTMAATVGSVAANLTSMMHTLDSNFKLVKNAIASKADASADLFLKQDKQFSGKNYASAIVQVESRIEALKETLKGVIVVPNDAAQAALFAEIYKSIQKINENEMRALSDIEKPRLALQKLLNSTSQTKASNSTLIKFQPLSNLEILIAFYNTKVVSANSPDASADVKSIWALYRGEVIVILEIIPASQTASIILEHIKKRTPIPQTQRGYNSDLVLVEEKIGVVLNRLFAGLGLSGTLVSNFFKVYRLTYPFAVLDVAASAIKRAQHGSDNMFKDRKRRSAALLLSANGKPCCRQVGYGTRHISFPGKGDCFVNDSGDYLIKTAGSLDNSRDIVQALNLPTPGGAFAMDNGLYDTCVSLLTNMSSRIATIKNDLGTNNGTFISTLQEFDKKIEELGGISRFTNTKKMKDVVYVQNIIGLYRDIKFQREVALLNNPRLDKMAILNRYYEKILSLCEASVNALEAYSTPPAKSTNDNDSDSAPETTIYLYSKWVADADKTKRYEFDARAVPFLYSNAPLLVSTFADLVNFVGGKVNSAADGGNTDIAVLNGGDIALKYLDPGANLVYDEASGAITITLDATALDPNIVNQKQNKTLAFADNSYSGAVTTTENFAFGMRGGSLLRGRGPFKNVTNTKAFNGIVGCYPTVGTLIDALKANPANLEFGLPKGVLNVPPAELNVLNTKLEQYTKANTSNMIVGKIMTPDTLKEINYQRANYLALNSILDGNTDTQQRLKADVLLQVGLSAAGFNEQIPIVAFVDVHGVNFNTHFKAAIDKAQAITGAISGHLHAIFVKLIGINKAMFATPDTMSMDTLDVEQVDIDFELLNKTEQRILLVNVANRIDAVVSAEANVIICDFYPFSGWNPKHALYLPMSLNGKSDLRPPTSFFVCANNMPRTPEAAKKIYNDLLAALRQNNQTEQISPDIDNELWRVGPVSSFERHDSIARITNKLGYTGNVSTQGVKFRIKFPDSLLGDKTTPLPVLIANSVHGTEITSSDAVESDDGFRKRVMLKEYGDYFTEDLKQKLSDTTTQLNAIKFKFQISNYTVRSNNIESVIAPFCIYTRSESQEITRSKFEVRPRGPSGVGKSRVLFGENGVVSKMINRRAATASICEVYLCSYPYRWSMEEAFKKKTFIQYSISADNALSPSTSTSNTTPEPKIINADIILDTGSAELFTKLDDIRSGANRIVGTNNNPNSSRSTVTVKIESVGDTNKKTEISVTDPPGVENIYLLSTSNFPTDEVVRLANEFIVAPVAFIAKTVSKILIDMLTSASIPHALNALADACKNANIQTNFLNQFLENPTKPTMDPSDFSDEASLVVKFSDPFHEITAGDAGFRANCLYGAVQNIVPSSSNLKEYVTSSLRRGHANLFTKKTNKATDMAKHLPDITINLGASYADTNVNLKELFISACLDVGTGVGAAPSFDGWYYTTKNAFVVLDTTFCTKEVLTAYNKWFAKMVDECYSDGNANASLDLPGLDAYRTTQDGVRVDPIISCIGAQRHSRILLSTPTNCAGVRELLSTLRTLGRKSVVVSGPTIRLLEHLRKNSANGYITTTATAFQILVQSTTGQIVSHPDTCPIFEKLDKNADRFYLVNSLYADDVFDMQNNVGAAEKAQTPFFYGAMAPMAFVLACDIFNTYKDLPPAELASKIVDLVAENSGPLAKSGSFVDNVRLKSESTFINDINFVYSEISAARKAGTQQASNYKVRNPTVNTIEEFYAFNMLMSRNIKCDKIPALSGPTLSNIVYNITNSGMTIEYVDGAFLSGTLDRYLALTAHLSSSRPNKIQPDMHFWKSIMATQHIGAAAILHMPKEIYTGASSKKPGEASTGIVRTLDDDVELLTVNIIPEFMVGTNDGKLEVALASIAKEHLALGPLLNKTQLFYADTPPAAKRSEPRPGEEAKKQKTQ